MDVPAGRRFRIINTEGGQVVDTWAFQSRDYTEHLSMAHSRSAIYRAAFHPGDILVSDRFRPMLEFIEDTSPGHHDTLHAACSAGSIAYFGASGDGKNCQANLYSELARRGYAPTYTPCPWNLFEHTRVAADLSLSDAPAPARAGDYVELHALMDLVVVCSACPSRVGNISGGEPRGAAVQIV